MAIHPEIALHHLNGHVAIPRKVLQPLSTDPLTLPHLTMVQQQEEVQLVAAEDAEIGTAVVDARPLLQSEKENSFQEVGQGRNGENETMIADVPQDLMRTDLTVLSVENMIVQMIGMCEVESMMFGNVKDRPGATARVVLPHQVLRRLYRSTASVTNRSTNQDENPR